MKKIMLLMLAFGASIFTYAKAPTDHQFYMQAYSELRIARWLIGHDNKALSADETKALAKIDEAVNELKKAGIDDGKDAKDVKADAVSDRRQELQKAMLCLDRAHADIDKEADINFANGLKAKVGKDVIDARELVKSATIMAK